MKFVVIIVIKFGNNFIFLSKIHSLIMYMERIVVEFGKLIKLEEKEVHKKIDVNNYQEMVD